METIFHYEKTQKKYFVAKKVRYLHGMSKIEFFSWNTKCSNSSIQNNESIVHLGFTPAAVADTYQRFAEAHHLSACSSHIVNTAPVEPQGYDRTSRMFDFSNAPPVPSVAPISNCYVNPITLRCPVTTHSYLLHCPVH